MLLRHAPAATHRCILRLCLALLPCACGSPDGAGTAARAQFDWFDYQGNDPIYQRVSAGADQFLNPILPGFYPDPSIVRVNQDYYLVNSSFAYFPGVPIFQSRDLVNWTQLGHVFDRPSQLGLDSLAISQGIFAPSLHHHDSTFYLVTTLIGGGGNLLVKARAARGPWSDPLFLGFDGIDPSLFFDDDGRAWIVNNGPPAEAPRYDGHRAIWLQEFDARTQKMIGPRTVLVNGGVDIAQKPIWIEGPHLFKVGGTYYLIAAEGGTADDHSEVVFRSAQVQGPYEPYSGNPILTQRQLDPNRPDPVTSTGHADFVETQKGEWWAVFLGVTPYEGNDFNTGRQTFLLPVSWRDGWPTILRGRETVPYAVDRPNLPRAPAPGALKSGNFRERDDFNADSLPLYWNFIRTPRERWYDLRSAPGFLTLRARPEPLHGRRQPSFLGRRQQHSFASATTALRYAPAGSGDRAGLVAFQNDDFYYCLCVTQRDGRRVIELEKRAGADSAGTAIVASAALPANTDSPLYLRIVARGAQYDFWYGQHLDSMTLLAENADGRILSTRVAGGFVGAYFGLYAFSATH